MRPLEKNKISFNAPFQIINMGGPWIGELYYGDVEVAKNVLIDNLVFSNERDKIFFIEYHEISRWQADNFFTINSLNTSGSLCQYEHKFKIIFIDDVDSRDNLFYSESFHSSNTDKRRMINIKGLSKKCVMIAGLQI